MHDDDGQYLLTVALEMRLAARTGGVRGEGSDLSPSRMVEIAQQLERIGTRALRTDASAARHMGRG